MAKAPVVEDADMLHAFKVAAVTGQTPTREIRATGRSKFGRGSRICLSAEEERLQGCNRVYQPLW